MNKIEKYFPQILLILLSLLAIYIRINGANYYHYSEDEAMIFGIANTKSIWQVVQFSLFETHPPLFYIILHYWLMISQDIWFARCLPLIFGIALIPLYYKIGKRLGGELTGLCAAILIVFSNVCITQSYVLRHYAIMSFFLSVAFYFYIIWREKFKNKHIILYTSFASLACFADFSAIFTIFTIAAFETINLFIQKKEIPTQAKWIISNVLIAAFLLISYKIWSGTIHATDIFFINIDAQTKLMGTLLYIPVVLGGVLPSIIIALAGVIFTPLIYKKSLQLRQLLYLFAIASLLGMILHHLIIYPVAGQRHWSWLMPLTIPLFALVISKTCELLAADMKLKSLNWQKYIAVVFIIAGLLNYNSETRFKEVIEYTISENDYQAAVKYINNLDKNSLLFAERDDAVLLNTNQPYFNLYEFIDENALSKKSLVTIVPYHDTNILISQYYRRVINKEMFNEIFAEAQTRNILDNTKDIIFMATKLTAIQGERSPIHNLILCPELDKKIIYFSTSRQGEKITKENIYDFGALFMTVSKKDLFEQVIAEKGKAHYCLDNKLKSD